MGNMVAPNTWAALIKYLGNELTESRYIDYLDRIYRNSNPDYQHIILDVVAKSPIRRDNDEYGTHRWHEPRLQYEAIGYTMLPTIMAALETNQQLEPTPEEPCAEYGNWGTITQEVTEHNTWVTSNPYTFPYRLTHEEPTSNEEHQLTMPLATGVIQNIVTQIAAITLCPPEYAPLILKYPEDTIPTIVNNDNLPGAVELHHQCVISGKREFKLPYMIVIALTHCPHTIIRKVWENKPLTTEEYKYWAEKVEDMFPARVHAHQTFTQEGYQYQEKHNWVIYRALGKATEPFITTGFNPMVSFIEPPLPTVLWLDEKLKEQYNNNMPMTLGENYLF